MLMYKAAKVEVLSLKIKEGHQLKNEREELVAPPHGSLNGPVASRSAQGAAQPASLVAGAGHQPPPAAANHAVHNEPEFVGGGHVALLAIAPALASMQHLHPANHPHPDHPPPAAVNVPHMPAHPHPQAPAKHALPHPQPHAPAKHAPVPSHNPPTHQPNQQAQPPQTGAVRGTCDGCGRNVMDADGGRVREGDAYFHAGCIKGMCGRCHLIVHANSERKLEGGVYWHYECWLTASQH
jgi:hypothetical protein